MITPGKIELVPVILCKQIAANSFKMNTAISETSIKAFSKAVEYHPLSLWVKWMAETSIDYMFNVARSNPIQVSK